jgi:hypothetical protein
MADRLKRVDEMTPADWFNYDRRDGSGGRIPRTDDPDPAPSNEELANAGFRRPDRPRAVPMDPGPTAAELIEGDGAAEKRREIRRLEVQLDFELHHGPRGAGHQLRVQQLRNAITELQDEIAAAEAA